MDSQSTKNTPPVLAMLQNVGSIFISMGAFLVSVFSDSSSDENSAEFTSGSLNYRTGKRDDGTDPYGWYDDE
ncbi:hypothetical protein E2F43_01555 [Seongchinamella unica]|uniref:Uncharacterized protein n=1 Tax=Seongchinamella unica TaxID=2547392 RepID=A0A4R5LUH1_9GAMM|nr:hypothetical protein [Seongchinamella unica]TDG14957.1 hypothetical protein E2F43_01555 [Seongchinamella unica]